jgi:hypothetical protein
MMREYWVACDSLFLCSSLLLLIPSLPMMLRISDTDKLVERSDSNEHFY